MYDCQGNQNVEERHLLATQSEVYNQRLWR